MQFFSSQIARAADMKLREHTKGMEHIDRGESQKSDSSRPIPQVYLVILLIILLLTIAAIVGMAIFLPVL